MLVSIFVYGFTALSLFLLAKSASRNRDKGFGAFEYVLSFIIFGIVVGARYRVGVDHLSYLEYYNSINLHTTTKNLETGFYAITWLFSTLGLHYFFYFAFWGILQLYLVYRSFQGNRFALAFSALYIMLGPIFFDWMNIMRQSIAVCAFACLIPYIKDHKLFRYVIAILLISLIHKSALICLPLFFLGYIKDFHSRTKLTISLFIISIIVGVGVPSIDFLPLQEIANFIGYDNYNIEMTLSGDTTYAAGWGPRRLSMVIVDFFIIYYFPIIRKRYNLSDIWTVFFTFFFIGSCLYNVVSGISGFLVRPLNYLLIFRIHLVGLLLYYTYYKDRSVFLLLLLFACTFTLIGVYSGYQNPADYAAESCLYKFFFFENPSGTLIN